MIGIVTVYKVNNYGTKLQAYAMQRLMSLYNEAELLGFVPGSDRRVGAVAGKLYLKIFGRKKKITRPDEDAVKRRNKAISSFDRYYKFGGKIEGNKKLKREIYKYNAVVCGSDQLWAPSNVIADYFTLTLVPNDITKLSYAASFGISSIPAAMRKKYARYLNRMQYISVREETGAGLVKELTGRDASVVLDPTLMVGRDEWDALCSQKERKIEGAYIFCYFLGKWEEHRKFAEELAKKTGLKIVTIPHFKEWNEADEHFGDVKLYEADPIDFLNCIKHAEYVCTDSFHGTVFSVIYEKNLAVFERFDRNDKESTNSRIYSLLGELNLENQLMNGKTSVQSFLDNRIQYDDVMNRLEALKEKSFQFLDTALGKRKESSK